MKYKMPIRVADFEQKLNATEDSAENSKKKKEKIVEDIERVKQAESQAISDYIKSEYDLKFLPTDDRTDEQLEQIASEKIAFEKQNEGDNLRSEANREKQAVLKRKENEKVLAEVDKQAIRDNYEKVKEGANSDAIRRGLGRSSVILNMLKEYDTKKLEKLSERDSEYKNTVAGLDAEIKELDANLSKALANLDMVSAFEINEKLEKLKAERRENNEKAVKYNNEVTAQLAKYKKQLLESEKGEAILKKVADQTQEYKKQITFDLIDYYGQIPLSEAIEDFASNDYASVLGDNQIQIIKNYLSMRKS